MKKVVTMITVICFLSLNFIDVQAQAGNDEFLKNVGKTTMYKTLQLAHMDRELSTFVNLVHLSGLAASMNWDEEHTLLIPTNDAFKKMSIENFAHITDPKNRADLIKFIQYHVLPNKVASDRFKEDQVIEVDDIYEDIPVTINNGMLIIGGAQVIKSDIEAVNGVIHIINGVIAPAYDDVFQK